MFCSAELFDGGNGSTCFLKETSDANIELSAIDTVLSISSPDEQIKKLEEVYAQFGHVYPQTVFLGGQLYRTESHSIESEAQGDLIQKQAETCFTTSIFKSSDLHGGFQSAENSGTRSYEQDSKQMIASKGGDISKDGDSTIWRETVKNPLLWAIIKQDDFQPIFKLLDEERKNKIEEIEKIAKSKKLKEESMLTTKYFDLESLRCEGRPCAKCNMCGDWHFTEDHTTSTWTTNWKHWSDDKWKRFFRDHIYKKFTKREGATCDYPLDDDYADPPLYAYAVYRYSYAIYHLCVCERH
ncbi:unnamed protein product [Adineta steineri]|uniref:MACPF-like domain-containing protein n=1 Tax=Adineta steineri TaxID=433720 RepID=A0A818XIA8_9BILA|nr:unnamed protein product [Adineta steineri]